jgi:uncharacterized protein with von Willebrand factor type A (vWA) domain
VPDAAELADAAEVTAALVGFARLLRERGLRLSPAEVSRFQAAVGLLPAGDIGNLYWAGRACLAVPPGFAATFDAAFAHYFLGIQGELAEPEARSRQTLRSLAAEDQGDEPSATVALEVAQQPGDQDGEAPEHEDAGSAASAVEVLRITPFASCTPQELDIVTALTRRLRPRPPELPGRRMVPGRRKEAVDLRATVRLAMKTQADMLLPAWRQHRRRPRRVVVLLDVSRSMAPYSRLYLHFGYALVVTRGAEVVCFGTQLTRITGLLRSRQSARALERAAMSVLDWNGGTRIADAVGGLRSMRSVRGALRGAVVVICSDGLEQGDPADLGHQMYLLHRTCHEIIWVNPLAGDERYQPIAGGMRAALPWVDALMPGDTLAALQDVAAALGNSGPLRPGPVRPPARSAGQPQARPAGQPQARPAGQPQARPAPARA